MARRPTATQDRPTSRRVGALAALWPFVRPYRGLVAAALLALLVTASISLVLPVAVRRVVDGFAERSMLLDEYFEAALVIIALVPLALGQRLVGGALGDERGQPLPSRPVEVVIAAQREDLVEPALQGDDRGADVPALVRQHGHPDAPPPVQRPEQVLGDPREGRTRAFLSRIRAS